MSLEFDEFTAQPPPAPPSHLSVEPLEELVVLVRPSRLAFCIFASATVLFTLAALPFLWGWVLIEVIMPLPDHMMPSLRDWCFAAALVVAVAWCMILSRFTARRSPSRATSAWLCAFVSVVWIGLFITLGLVFLSPRALMRELVSGLVVGSLWLLWLAWLPLWPLRWFVGRLLVLLMLLAMPTLFVLLFRYTGPLGDSLNQQFTWRGTVTEADVDADDEFVAEANLLDTTANDFPQFLGPRRRGCASSCWFMDNGEWVEYGLDKDWHTHPPVELWRQPIGAGWGGFVIVGDYAVTQEQRGDYECVTCLRVSDGSLMWRHRDRARFRSVQGGVGPRATPTIHEGRVYTVGATGILNCLDGSTGEAIWSINILDDNGAKNNEHGVAASPLIYGDLVMVCPTGKGGPSLVAYDRRTGERIWAKGTQQASYSSPTLAEIDGVDQVLLFTSAGIVGHDAGTGEVLWNFPWASDSGVNCAEPIPNAWSSGQVFVSTGYGKGCVLVKVVHNNDDTWSADWVWKSHLMQTKFSTPIELWGFVYGLDSGMLECIQDTNRKNELEDAEKVPVERMVERRWKQGRYGHGQILQCYGQSQGRIVPELLIVQAEDGSVHLVRMTHARLTELGSVPGLSDNKTWNNPALAGRYLLIRNDKEAMCYELSLEGRGE
jgi:outer membrane protein assembly factor BamB